MERKAWLQERIISYRYHLSTLFLVGGALFLYFGTQKQLTLIVNDQIHQVSTHARTIQALLSEVDISLQDDDEISHTLDAKVRDDQIILVKSSRPTIIDEEGELVLVQTTASLPENILIQSDTRIFPGDSVRQFGQYSLKQQQPSTNTTWLRLDHGYPIRLEVDGESRLFSSSATTLGEALWEIGIKLQEGDHLDPPPNTPLDGALEVSLQRASTYIFQVDGETLTRRAAGETVEQILSQAGIILTGLDYTIPEMSEAAPADGQIRVVRVVEQQLVELEPVEFETVYRPADQLELDTLEVLEPGTFGVQSKTVRIRYEDGEEVNRTIEDAVIAVEPKDRVIGYGTRIVVRTLDTPQGTIEYWRAIPVYATAYSPCNLGVPWCGTLTASGKEVKRGIIGVIRSWYNLMRGWSVFVPGYGPGTFEDIGAGIAGRDWIDLGFTDENIEPWHDWTTLYFLTPVPPLDSIPWILP